jgi:uncharacterized RDD family membrane protein YckC
MATQVMSSALAPAAVATRVIAYILDAIVLGIVGIFIVGTFYSDVSVVGSVVRTIIYAVFGYAYFGYTWTAWRASPGQRMFGLMTVNAADGATLTWNQATMRWLYLFGPSVFNSLFTSANTGIGGLSGLVSLIVLIYYIYLLWTTAQDVRHQGFHDKQSNTIVAIKSAA